MKIQIFTLCDYAQSNMGKLSIIGTFNRIFADKFPYVYTPAIFCVAKVTSTEQFEGKFTFSALKPDRSYFFAPLSGDVKIENPSNDKKEKSFDFNITFNNQLFPEPGTYTFKFKVGDIEAVQELYLEQTVNG